VANYKYQDYTGLIVADTDAIKAEVIAEFKGALGDDLITDDNTPQGVLINAEVLAREAVIQNNAVTANQINPNFSEGVFLDAIWALTRGQRKAATKTTVSGVTLGGLEGTFIPAGSLASLADGAQFETIADATITAFGTVTVDFQAVESGPVAVAVGALNQVVTGINGWDTVTNPSAGVTGTSLESDVAARLRRRQTLSLQNVGMIEAVSSSLYDVEGIKSLKVRENVTGSTATIDGISLIENSIWVCVDGGTNADIATTLLKNKSIGAGWNGAVSVPIVEPSSGQTYTVKFDRPTSVPVRARLTVRGAQSTDVVRQAIVAYAAGEQDGEQGFVVGESVSSFEIAGAVNRALPSVFVQSCEVSLSSTISWGAGVAIAINKKATINAGDIEVTLA
jgi:hypothetical protein